MNNNSNEEIEIDLKEVLMALVQHIWLIVLAVALGLGLALGYTILFVKPTYRSTSILYVISSSTSITSLADIQVSSSLTKDYMVVITSRPVLEKVIDNLQLDMSYEGLKSQVSVVNPDNTRFLEITVNSGDAYLAKQIVDEIADVSADRMEEVMETDKPNVMDYGQVASSPSAPNIKKNALIGGLLGFVLACGIVVIMYLMDDSIKTPEDVEKYLGINTLGIIPLSEGVSKRKTRGHDASARRRKSQKK